MKLKQLFEDEGAVSPVIGVILMVAITVILAAVIGTFVLGLGDQVQQTAPNTQMSFDYSQQTVSGADVHWDGNVSSDADGVLSITHDGGDAVRSGQLELSGASGYEAEPVDGFAWGSDEGDVDYPTNDPSQRVSAGFSANAAVNNSDTVRVVWTAQSGDQSSTVARWTGPDA